MNIDIDELYYSDDATENDKKLKNMIGEIVDILDTNQLIETIDQLKKPFYTKKLQDYLISENLPPLDSQEFAFLVQSAKYNGNIVKKIIRESGISNYNIDKYIAKYQLNEINRGIYVFPNKPIDAQFLFQAQYTRAVISHETALYLHDLSDVIPRYTIMSIPLNYNFSQIEKNENRYIKINTSSYNNNKALVLQYDQNDSIYLVKNTPISSSQIKSKKTIYGNDIRVTSMERTIADIFKSNTEEEVKQNALKKYHQKNPDYDKRLLRIAKQQNVETKVKQYLWELQIY